MMSAKENILAKLRTSLAGTTPLADDYDQALVTTPWSYPAEQRIPRLRTLLEAVHGETCLTTTAAWPARVVEALGARGIAELLISPATAHGQQFAGYLALHGGIFLPMSSVLRLRDYSVPSAEAEGDGGFTSRQRAVAEALRRGKPNKLIAYELAMCESTVKVHVRKIMKKLEARNRTEASYKLNTLLTSQTAEFDEDLAS
ncbi:MAG: hypothetical protein CVU28_03115 [Betaproteobacteria bacterium HGW-Betaproteobacteria-21]|nr:MAG: hypothetical protein CVU28_03115 [Betaproteobacteria bacterium HGW-Betaproteobacteria-21]